MSNNNSRVKQFIYQIFPYSIPSSINSSRWTQKGLLTSWKWRDTNFGSTDLFYGYERKIGDTFGWFSGISLLASIDTRWQPWIPSFRLGLRLCSTVVVTGRLRPPLSDLCQYILNFLVKGQLHSSESVNVIFKLSHFLYMKGNSCRKIFKWQFAEN